MAVTVLVDTGFLVALLSRSDTRNAWAQATARTYPPPWQTCEAVLTEAFHLLGDRGRPGLIQFLRMGTVKTSFSLSMDLDRILVHMRKYSEIPMSFADACLVRMTENFTNSVLLTTDGGFRVYRRLDRQIIPCAIPS